MIVLLPIRRYRIDYSIARGRPFSGFERLLLEAISNGHQDLAKLYECFRIHRRVLIEGIVTLMHAGWIELDLGGHRFIASASGRAALADPSTTPRTLEITPRRAHVFMERVTGQLGRRSEFRIVSRSQVATSASAITILRKADLPNALVPGMVHGYLPRTDGAWIHWIGDITPDQADGLFALADVDLKSNVIIGLPERWAVRLRDEILSRAHQHAVQVEALADSESIQSLRRLVRVARPDADKAPIEDYSISVMPEDFLVSHDEHDQALLNVFETARSCIVISSQGLSENHIERLRPSILRALSRGVTVDICWGTATGTGHEAALRILRKIDYDSHQSGGLGRLLVGATASQSTANIVLSDAGGNFQAFLGSCPWLGDEKVASGVRYLSVCLRISALLARFCLVAADLAGRDSRLSTGAGVQRLRNAAASIEAAGVSLQSAPGLGGSVSARILLDREHTAAIYSLAANTSVRLDVVSTVWGTVSGGEGTIAAAAALVSAVKDVAISYTSTLIPEAERLVTEDQLRKKGCQFDRRGDLFANVVLADKDTALLTGRSYLGVPERALAPLQDIGILFTGIGLAELIRTRLELVQP